MYKTISPRYFCVTMVLYYIANAYILGNDQVASRDSWLCLLMAALLLAPVLPLYAALSRRWPGKNLFEIFREALSPGTARFAAGIYAVYGILVLAMSLNCFGLFVQHEILPDTPTSVMELLIVLCSVYLVIAGGSVIGKWGAFVFPLVMLFIAVSLLGAIPSLEPGNLLPIAENRKNAALGVYRLLAFPVGEPVILFALLPSVRGEFGLRHWILPFLAAMLILALTYARNTMVLGGALAGVMHFTTSHADSITDYLNFSQHTEALTSLIPAVAGIMEASLALLFVSQGLAAVFVRQEAKGGVIAGAAAGLLFSILVLKSEYVLELRDMIWPGVSLVLQTILPMCCTIVPGMRKRLRRKILERRLKRQLM